MACQEDEKLSGLIEGEDAAKTTRCILFQFLHMEY